MIEWVSVKDRLPDYEGDFLVCGNSLTEKPIIGVASFSKERELKGYLNWNQTCDCGTFYPTHWAEINMPEDK